MPKFRDGMGISMVKERSRLAVAARLATKLAPLDDAAAIAQTAVDELHSAFGFFLAVVQRLDAHDATLRVVAAAGPLADEPDFLAYEQPVHEGVNGRVARTGEPAVIPDTAPRPGLPAPRPAPRPRLRAVASRSTSTARSGAS